MKTLSVVLFTTICLWLGPVKAQQVTRMCLQDASSPNSCIPFGSSGGLTTINGATTITTGNTFQSVLAASNNRNSLTIQNNNTNGDNCWVFIGANASATAAKSILLGPGGSYQRYMPFIPSDNISATCATTSDTLYVDTQ